MSILLIIQITDAIFEKSQCKIITAYTYQGFEYILQFLLQRHSKGRIIRSVFLTFHTFRDVSKRPSSARELLPHYSCGDQLGSIRNHFPRASSSHCIFGYFFQQVTARGPPKRFHQPRVLDRLYVVFRLKFQFFGDLNQCGQMILAHDGSTHSVSTLVGRLLLIFMFTWARFSRARSGVSGETGRVLTMNRQEPLLYT